MGKLIAAHGKVSGAIGIYSIAGQIVTSHLTTGSTIVGPALNEEDGLHAGLGTQRRLIGPNALAQQKAVPTVERHVRRHGASLPFKRAPDLFQVLKRVGQDGDPALRARQDWRTNIVVLPEPAAESST